MTKFEKTKRRIQEYQKSADKQFAIYQQKEKQAREKFSEQGFREEFMMKEWPAMAGRLQSDANAAIREIDDLFEDIREELNDWIMKPIDNSTTQILACINNFDLKLSLPELKVIEQSVRSSHFGTKIFAGLAAKNGYDVKIPEMQELLKELDSTKDNAHLAIRAYAGAAPAYPGRDLLPKWEYNGVVQGEYQDFHLFYAYSFLDNAVIDKLEQLYGDSHAPMRYILTDSEAEKVEESISKIINADGEIDREKAAELVKKEPDFADKLKSMPNLENESVKKYFGLDVADKQGSGESRISSAAVIAKEYIGNLGPVNMEMLSQFK